MKHKKSTSRLEFFFSGNNLLNSKLSTSRLETANSFKIMPVSKRSQAWGIDLMIASIIFTIAIVIFFFYALNNPEEGELNIDRLYYDGRIIGDSILSEGYPKDWNLSNVVTIGILSDNKINETKLNMFFNLSDTEYSRTKSLFNTPYNYYFFLSENMTLSFGEVEGIGSKPLTSQNLIKVSRFTIYNNTPVTAYVYIWN